MKLTIRKKLLGLSFIAIVIPLLVSAAVIIYIVSNESSKESIKRINTNANVAITQYGRRMNNISTAAKQLAISALQYDFVESFRGTGATAAQAAQLELERRKAANVMDINRKQVGLDYLILTDETGKVLYRVNNPEQRRDDLAAIDPLLRAALDTRKVIFGSTRLPIDFVSMEKLDDTLNLGLQKKSTESALSMEVVVPLILGDQFRGALLTGDIINNDNALVDDLKQMVFRDMPEAGSATIYLGGVAVASSRKGTFGRGIGDSVSPEINDRVLSQGKDFIGPETINNVNYISAYVPIKDVTNKIIGIYSVSVQEQWFHQFRDFIRNFIIIVIVAAIVISILITYIAATRLTKPIEEITEAANRISLGDLEIPIQVKAAGDEIERLGESLDRMRISLKSAIERLRRR